MRRTQTQINQEVVDKYLESGEPWPTTATRLVMVSFTYMRSEADRVLTPLPRVLIFVLP
jgi:hypothetical protein